jgi:uncharacterized protein YlxP (DUF503 family)
MNRGWIGILSAELHFPEAHSLKEKRMYLRSAKSQLQNRFGAAVAEVDHHDVWQRARITAALVTREHGEAERRRADAERYLASREWELGLVEREIVGPEDAR